MKAIRFSILPVAVCAVLLSGCNFSLAADVTPPPGYQAPSPAASTDDATSGPLFPVLPPDPSKGAATYIEKCAPCHGVGGLGDGPNAAALPNPVSALASPEVAHGATPAEWFGIVTNGNLENFMPPFRSLSDRQRWDVVAYSFMLSNPSAELERGADLFQAECASCHGSTGMGDGTQTSTSAPDLTEQERMAAKSEANLFEVITNGAGEKMPAFGDQISEDDRWALAGYVRSLSFVSAPSAAVTQVAEGTPGSLGAAAVTGEALETPQAAVETQTTGANATPEAASAMGMVSGLVATGNGNPAAGGLEVNLHAFEQMDLIYTRTTTLQGDGTYAFENLVMKPGLAYLSTVEFDGVVYGSDVAVAESETDQLDLPIEVFETTSDTSSLSVDRLHYFIEFVDEDTLRMLELFIISNTSDKTVIPADEGQPLLEFQLPPGAENLQFESGALGERFVETAGGFGDTLPIRPGAGNYQVLYSYELPYDRNLELVRTTPLLTQAVIVLAPQDGVKVKGETLEDAGLREIQGVQYQMYNAPAMGRESELRLTISGRPGSSGITLASSSNTNLVVGLASFGLVLLGAGAWWFTRNRKPAANGSASDTVDLDDTPQLTSREAVMDAILALDDLYQEGKLPENAYLERRAVLKARLKELIEP